MVLQYFGNVEFGAEWGMQMPQAEILHIPLLPRIRIIVFSCSASGSQNTHSLTALQLKLSALSNDIDAIITIIKIIPIPNSDPQHH